MSDNFFILGGGVTGLIAGHFLRDFVVISKDIKGQMSNELRLGPRYIYDNKYNRKLLKELKMTFSKRNVKIGFMCDGKITNKCSDEMKKIYLNKSRISGDDNVIGSVMSSGKNNFNILECDQNILMDRLVESVGDRFISHNVDSIDLVDKTITVDNKIIKYKKVISTINFGIFCKLCGESDDKNINDSFSDIYFYFVGLLDDFVMNELCLYDYIYFVDEKYKFNRITKCNDMFVLESPVKLEQSDCHGILELRNEIVLKNVKISKNANVSDLNDVKFVGRFSQVDSSVKIHDTIKKIIELKKNGI